MILLMICRCCSSLFCGSRSSLLCTISAIIVHGKGYAGGSNRRPGRLREHKEAPPCDRSRRAASWAGPRLFRELLT